MEDVEGGEYFMTKSIFYEPVVMVEGYAIMQIILLVE